MTSNPDSLLQEILRDVYGRLGCGCFGPSGVLSTQAHAGMHSNYGRGTVLLQCEAALGHIRRFMELKRQLLAVYKVPASVWDCP